MNLRTTLVLIALTAAGGTVVWSLSRSRDEGAAGEASSPESTLAVFKDVFQEENIQKVVVERRGQEILTCHRDRKGRWELPGGWPAEESELARLVQRLCSLRSRFAPIPLESDAGLAKFNLHSPEFLVTLEAKNGRRYKLSFAEGFVEDNRFFRPLFVRLDDRPEVIRLAPGLLGVLGQPRDTYQTRQLLHPSESEARKTGTTGSADRVDRLIAHQVQVALKGKEGFTYALGKDQRGWHLRQPTVDRLDPAQADRIREALADLWAERFMEGSPADVAALFGALAPGNAVPLAAALPAFELGLLLPQRKPGANEAETSGEAWRRSLSWRYGLDNAEREIRVQKSEGDDRQITIRIGQVFGTQPGPTVPGPMGDMIGEPREFHLAEVVGNRQLFLVRGKPVKDLFVQPSTLRDRELARFDKADVVRVEIKQGSEKMTLVRDESSKEEKWTLEVEGESESQLADLARVKELVDKLAELKTQDAEKDEPVLRGTVLGMLGSPLGAPLLTAASVYPHRTRGTVSPDAFNAPLAEIRLSVTEDRERAGANRKTRTVTLRIGDHDAQNKVLLVKVDDWDRVEVVEDAPWSILKRPALAYRGKLFDLDLARVEKLVIEKEKEKIALTQSGNKWRMNLPAESDADPGRIAQLLSLLGKLEPTEYLSEPGKGSELEQRYGLGKEAVGLTIQVAGKLKQLKVGKQREGKMEHFAKLEGNPTVFVIGPDVPAALRANSLAYLPIQLWRLEPADLKSVRLEKEGAEPFTLERQENDTWKLTAPLNTPALETVSRGMIEVLSNPFCEEHRAHKIDDPKKYGLDKPFVKVTLVPAKKDEPQRELIVGNRVKEDSPDRYARSSAGESLFVLRGDVITHFDRGALDLIDTQLLSVNLADAQSIRGQVGESRLILKPENRTWKVHEATPEPFLADENALASLRGTLFSLRAEKFAYYGGKPDLAKHGLDKPSATLSVSLGEAGKAREVSITLGAEVPGLKGQRYARVGDSPGIAILSARDTEVLARTYLDYVNHRMFSFAAEKVSGLKRQTGMETLRIAKEEDEWRIKQPRDLRADDRTVENLFRQLSVLRAARVAEYPLRDANKYGLEKPALVVTLDVMGKQHVLSLGDDAKDGQRFARVDEVGTVFVLGADLVRILTADPVTFRSRALVRFSDAEKILLERGPRRATLARVEGTWSLTEPLRTKVDNDQVEDFLNRAARLTADELVADKPADLKPYGLEKPVARWRFQIDEKDVLDLQIGKRDPTGKRVYARLGNDTLVFLLSPEMTAKVLGEFRDRMVWATPPDVVQVDTLRLTRDGKTVTLKKDGAVWSCVEKPTAKINGETVNDTLAALAGLKLERFAVDKGADRKLFGLEPPVLIVEAEGGEKKTVLHVGRFEGESKQAYAALPEKERGDVFILSEADTARLTRELEAFGKPLPVEKAREPAPR